MAKYYYRFDTGSVLGKAFRRFWNELTKAERARNIFLQKVGAEGWQDDETMMAGGVTCVSFADDAKVDRRWWRPSHKDADGVQMWVPNVERRTGYIILPRRTFCPSDTANRVYSKRIASWPQARLQYTVKEWAALAGITLTGDKKQDETLVEQALHDADFMQYIEFYVRDYDPAEQTADARRRKIPWWVREAVHIEMQRTRLPMVTIEAFYRLLQAEMPATDGKGVTVITETTPTFFEWGSRYYVGCSRPCKHEDLEDVTAESYNLKMTTLRQSERLSGKEN